MKILLCAIGRLENQYVKEWVDYYKNLGVDNICLYDNNKDGEDDFHEAIGEDIDSGFVILKNVRNAPPPIQMIVYKSCYDEFKQSYDWIMFFDIDEFLTMTNGKTIKEHLSNSMFDNFNVIHINWVVYGDCGLIENDGRPVLERFSFPIFPELEDNKKNKENEHIKSIVRGKLSGSCSFPCPHTAVVSGNCCSFDGISCSMSSPFNPPNYDNGYLKHFTTKTVIEFVRKIKRGFCDVSRKYDGLVNIFFCRNERTKEKEDVFRREGIIG